MASTKTKFLSLADLILFLASEKGKQITGQLIGIDGNLEWESYE